MSNWLKLEKEYANLMFTFELRVEGFSHYILTVDFLETFKIQEKMGHYGKGLIY